jgi:hypothetical protein
METALISTKDRADERCCTIDLVDVSKHFLQGNPPELVEVVKVRSGGKIVDAKCCCKKQSEECKLRTWEVGTAGGCGTPYEWLAWHFFFAKGEEKQLPVERRCMIPALEADLFQDNMVRD